jgi:hypothetical protein
MNSSSISIRVALALTGAFLIVGAANSLAAPVTAVVKDVQGTVEFAPPGSASFSPLKVGQELTVGSTVRTGSNGSTDIITTPGSAIQVGADTKLRLNALAFAQSGSTVTQREAHIDLQKGTVSALIDPSTPHVTDFQVQTPEGSAAARGTFYAVSVDRGKVGALAELSQKR